MIVEPGFLDHYKTQALIHAAGEAAPLMLIRLWEHCQCRKTNRFPNLTDVALASICRWTKTPAELKAIFLECGFLRVENNVVIVHDWEKSNRHLIGAWVNGAKGGRPRKLQTRKTDRLTDRVTDPSIYIARKKSTTASTSVLSEEKKKEEVQGGDFVPTPLDVYKAYPLKVGRPRAIQEIQRAIAKFGAVFVLERTVLFANTRNGDKSFMPHPSTWFHQERFNDDPSTWRRNGEERPMSAFEIKKRQDAITEEINRIFKRNGSKRIEGDGIEELKKHRAELQHQLTV